jgi:hypothetical protein
MSSYVTQVIIEGKDGTKVAVASASKGIQAYAKTATAANKTVQASSRAARSSIQQIGYQAQDVAVQLQAGQNPFLVLSQQGSQIASIFGPGGAVAGAFIAIAGIIGMNLAPALFKSTTATDDLKEAQDRLKSILEKTGQGAAIVSEEFAKLAKFSAGAAKVDALIAQQQAMKALSDASKEMVEGIEDVALGNYLDVFDGLSNALNIVTSNAGLLDRAVNGASDGGIAFATSLSTINAVLDDFEENLGISRSEAGSLLSVLAKFKQAKTPEEFGKLADELAAVTSASTTSSPELLKVLGSLTQLAYNSYLTNEQLAELDKLLASLPEGAQRTQGSIDGAADAAKQAAADMRSLNDELDKLDAYKAQFDTPFEKHAKAIAKAEAYLSDTRDTETYERAVSAADATLAKYLETLNKVPKSFTVNQTAVEKYQDSIKDLASAVDSTAMSAIKNMEDSLVGLVDGTTSVEDAFRNMASSIIKDLLRIQIQQTLMGPLSGLLNKGIGAAVGYMTGSPYLSDGGGMPLADGNDWASFAGGGYTGAGARSGGVDGKGGFPALLHPNETVVDHSQGQSMGESVTVVQNINISTGVQQTVRAEISNLLPQIANAAKGAVADARQRGGGFSKAMGA